jgi:hypothetical protein
MIKPHNQALVLAHAVKIRNSLKRSTFAFLGPLPITRVQQRDVLRAVPLSRNRRANARIHASAQKDHSFRVLRIRRHPNSL